MTLLSPCILLSLLALSLRCSDFTVSRSSLLLNKVHVNNSCSGLFEPLKHWWGVRWDRSECLSTQNIICWNLFSSWGCKLSPGQIWKESHLSLSKVTHPQIQTTVEWVHKHVHVHESDCVWGRGDGSTGKALVVQMMSLNAQGSRKKLGAIVCICNPSTLVRRWKAENSQKLTG